MSDEQDQAEALDDDELDGAYPPDQVMGVPDAVSEAGTDPGAPESVVGRSYREEPEEAPLDELPTISDVDAGDPTTSDVVQEREAPVPAEMAAVHVIDEDLGGFESDVDDPELEAAYEIDPEVDR